MGAPRWPRNPGGVRAGVIFEFIPRGAYIKVSAIHEASGTEVSIVGDSRVMQSDLERIARRKLDKVMADKAETKKRR